MTTVIEQGASRSGKMFGAAMEVAIMLSGGKSVVYHTTTNADRLINMLSRIDVKAKATLEEDKDMVAIGAPNRDNGGNEGKTYRIELIKNNK